MLLIDTQNNTQILTLNRPDFRNALNQQLQKELRSALEHAHSDPAIRSIIITGNGSAFCAGLDLSELQKIREQSTESNHADSQAFAALLHIIYTYPKPIIAAVNGHAVAGGAGLATICDITLMSDSAKIGYTEVKIGFVPAIVATFLLRQLGEKRCRDLLLTGRLITANEAHQMGLVNEVHPANTVLSRALELARGLEQSSPTALRLTKQLLASLPGMGLQEGLEYSSSINALARTTDDLNEGIQAFLEKRPPCWQKP